MNRDAMRQELLRRRLAGHAPVQPVRLIVLRPVPVTRPERFAFRWEQR